MGLIAGDFDKFFLQAIDGLEPYLDELVVIGGTANALYRHHPLCSPSSGEHPGTKDLDLATHRKLREGDKPPLRTLLEKLNLKTELYGDGKPPVMKFVSKKDPTLDLELLCPSSGNRNEQAHEIQKGVSAQPLSYLSLLLHEPWSLALAAVPEFKGSKLSVKIPSPYCYVMQKVLIQGRRGEKRSKDLYYIYEIAVLFRNALAEISKARGSVEREFPKPWSTRFRKNLASLFLDPGSEGPQAAAKIGNLDPKMVFQASAKLVEAILK